MESNGGGIDPFNTPGINHDADPDQDSRPLHGLSPPFTYLAPPPHSSLTSSSPSNSILDSQQWLRSFLDDSTPPAGPPPATTVSPTDLHTFHTLPDLYTPTPPFGFPSPFPHIAYPVGTSNLLGPWINEGSASGHIPLPTETFQEIPLNLDTDSPTVIGSASGPSSSSSPLDPELMELLALSNLFSPTSSSFNFGSDYLSPVGTKIPSSPGHDDPLLPPPQDAPVATHLPFVTTFDLPPSLAPQALGDKAPQSSRRQSSHKRKASEDEHEGSPQLGEASSSSALPIGRKRQRTYRSPKAGYSVLELDVAGTRSSATNLEGAPTMGRLSFASQDTSKPRCLHDRTTQKKPRHWKYNCKYNPDRKRLSCKHSTCKSMFSSKSNMERHFNKYHASGDGSGS